jgi:hypothetical protein
MQELNIPIQFTYISYVKWSITLVALLDSATSLSVILQECHLRTQRRYTQRTRNISTHYVYAWFSYINDDKKASRNVSQNQSQKSAAVQVTNGSTSINSGARDMANDINRAMSQVDQCPLLSQHWPVIADNAILFCPVSAVLPGLTTNTGGQWQWYRPFLIISEHWFPVLHLKCHGSLSRGKKYIFNTVARLHDWFLSRCTQFFFHTDINKTFGPSEYLRKISCGNSSGLFLLIFSTRQLESYRSLLLKTCVCRFTALLKHAV